MKKKSKFLIILLCVSSPLISGPVLSSLYQITEPVLIRIDILLAVYIERQDRNKLFCNAAERNNVKAMRYCLESKIADLKFQDEDGNTPLHYAAAAESHRAARFLLNHGANPNMQNYSCQTPAMHAQSPEMKEILRKKS